MLSSDFSLVIFYIFKPKKMHPLLLIFTTVHRTKFKPQTFGTGLYNVYDEQLLLNALLVFHMF